MCMVLNMIQISFWTHTIALAFWAFILMRNCACIMLALWVSRPVAQFSLAVLELWLHGMCKISSRKLLTWRSSAWGTLAQIFYQRCSKLWCPRLNALNWLHPPTMWRSWIAWRRLLYLNRSNRLSPPALKPSVQLVFKAQSLCRLDLKVWLCLGITFADLNGKRFKLKGVPQWKQATSWSRGSSFVGWRVWRRTPRSSSPACWLLCKCSLWRQCPPSMRCTNWHNQCPTLLGPLLWSLCLVACPSTHQAPLSWERLVLWNIEHVNVFFDCFFKMFHAASGTSCTHFHLNVSILVLKHLLAIPCRHSLQLSTALMTYLWHKHLRILFPVQFALANKSKSEAAPKSCMPQWLHQAVAKILWQPAWAITWGTWWPWAATLCHLSVTRQRLWISFWLWRWVIMSNQCFWRVPVAALLPLMVWQACWVRGLYLQQQNLLHCLCLHQPPLQKQHLKMTARQMMSARGGPARPWRSMNFKHTKASLKGRQRAWTSASRDQLLAKQSLDLSPRQKPSSHLPLPAKNPLWRRASLGALGVVETAKDVAPAGTQISRVCVFLPGRNGFTGSSREEWV